jgi:large subunit ribosomal protein L21
MKFAVIKTGGKQYIVSENDEVVVDNLNQDLDATVEFEKLAEGDSEAETITLGTPVLATSVKGKIVENMKGDKIRVARYKSKTRYRKVTGFRPMLSRVKIVSL